MIYNYLGSTFVEICHRIKRYLSSVRLTALISKTLQNFRGGFMHEQPPNLTQYTE